jgi:hypothetical protein
MYRLLCVLRASVSETPVRAASGPHNGTHFTNPSGEPG